MTASRPIVVSLHRANAFSGLTVSGARLARLPEPHLPWRPLVLGEDITPQRLASSPLVEISGVSVLSWPAGTGPVEQCLLVRDRLRELGARVVVPNDLAHGFVAATLDHHRGVRAAALCHSNAIPMLDFLERCLPLADALRGVSASIADHASKLAPGLVRRAALPPGVPVPGAPLPRVSTDDRLHLLYAGWLDPGAKRVLDLADLCAHLHAQAVPFELLIVGDGPARHQLEALTRAHVEAGRVRFFGPAHWSAMAPHFAWCDALVLCSAFEGAPAVVAEALAAGRPACITRGCGLAAELLRDGVEGLVVDVGDMRTLARKLAQAFAIPGVLTRMGDAAHAGAKRWFDLPTLAPRYDEFVREAAGAPARVIPARPETVRAAWVAMMGAMETIGSPTPESLLGLARAWFQEINAPHLLMRAGLEAIPMTPPRRATLAARLLHYTVSELQRHGFARVGLYGAGRHTARLAGVLADVPAVVAVLDDRAARGVGAGGSAGGGGDGGGVPSAVGGLPVLSPVEMDSLHLDAIVVSSDDHEPVMIERARAWAGSRPVLGLYNDPDRLQRALQPEATSL